MHVHECHFQFKIDFYEQCQKIEILSCDLEKSKFQISQEPENQMTQTMNRMVRKKS